jgi:hypothetical protein
VNPLTVRRSPLAAVLASAFLFATSCAHSIERPPQQSGPRRAYRLLGAVLERETSRFPTKRTDVEVDTRDYERVPHVVAVGESPKFRLDGAHVRIYGDEAGTLGVAVDNFILFEILDENGKRLHSAVAGFTDPVALENERVDNVGKLSFTFEPGEIDLTAKLPDSERFSVRATALDYNGVGKVSDVYMVVEYPKDKLRTDDDDLRAH